MLVPEKKHVILGRNLCLPKAICLGLAFQRRFTDSLWRSVSRSEKRLVRMAWKLQDRAGINKTQNYDIEDIRHFQTVLTHVQLIVFADNYRDKPLFVGPYRGDDRVIGIRLKQNHFDHVKRLGSYLGKFCIFWK